MKTTDLGKMFQADRCQGNISEVNYYMAKIFLWMVIGVFNVALSTIVLVIGMAVFPSFAFFISTNLIGWRFLLLVFLQIALLLHIQKNLFVFGKIKARVMYLLYTGTFGVTIGLPILGMAFATPNGFGILANTFVTTVLVFGTMALWGFFTNRNMTALGNFCTMCLIGLIVFMLVGWVFGFGIGPIVSLIGVVLFALLTAADTNKLRNMYWDLTSTGTEEKGTGTSVVKSNLAVFGATILFLDVLNIFLFIFILGSRK